MMFEITDDWLLKNRTVKGGYTKAQLEVIGISWPPAKNWKEFVIGKSISEENAKKFEMLKAKYKINVSKDYYEMLKKIDKNKLKTLCEEADCNEFLNDEISFQKKRK